MKKAIVLSSGGIDSTTCVALAVKELGVSNVITVSVYYAQRHYKELDCASKVAEYYGVKHKVIDLSSSGILNSSTCSLLQNVDTVIPEGDYANQIDRSDTGIVSTYVPFRNGLILAAVASLAMSEYPNDCIDIYLGVHADDVAGSAYADCSSEFTDAMNLAISLGTYNRVCLKAPLVNLNKADVVKVGLDLGAPYELTWSCYLGGEKPCGVCATCIDRKLAFEKNGVEDPADEIYKNR